MELLAESAGEKLGLVLREGVDKVEELDTCISGTSSRVSRSIVQPVAAPGARVTSGRGSLPPGGVPEVRWKRGDPGKSDEGSTVLLWSGGVVNAEGP